jgi:hypothetical protein
MMIVRVPSGRSTLIKGMPAPIVGIFTAGPRTLSTV